ncbi:Retrovirus-related Pol polyprotein from transposon 17.6 [Dictyocoela muelleri]|nr:Retrovirus-related Pol polyprotein from transposon 17.6 [Dictyocoela muelleri]
MNKMLKDLSNAMTYIDDILIFSKNVEKQVTTLSKVITILNENSVLIKFEKSKFCINKIEFLGHEISYKGIKQNTTKLDKFTMKIPKNKKATSATLKIGSDRS